MEGQYITRLNLITGIINFIHFSRLHTIIGTFAATTTIFLVIVSGINNITSANSLHYVIFLFGAVSINIFVVGINQIYDVEIDRINKPHLPLAKGDFSIKTGWIISILGLFFGLFISMTNIILFIAAIIMIVIGIIYSVPPFRLRNNFLSASLLIILGRGLLLNLSAYFYFNSEINGSYKVNDEIFYILTFILFFTIVISLFKDIPDKAGDSIFQVRTLVTIIDKSQVYNICISLLLINYITAIFFQLFILDLFHEMIFLTYHIFIIFLLGLSLKFKYRIINSLYFVRLYYKYIWVLLYLEYLTIAFLTS